MRQWPGELQGAYKSSPRKKGFWPFSLAGWFYMDRNNAVWSGHIVAPLWIPHLPIFGKKLTPGPLGPKKGPKRPFWGPRRKNQNVRLRSHRNCGRFGTNLSVVALFVSELRSFSQCTMVPLLTRSCFKSNKVRLISNGYFLCAISKNICLNVFESKQRGEKLLFFILKL